MSAEDYYSLRWAVYVSYLPWLSVCTACALRGHCVRTACILRTQRLGYSPKNTYHLFTSTAKQQSPHQNNKTAFSLVIKCRYEQANQPYKVQLCKGMQDAHMFKFWLLVL